jgi:hypothetical protein
MGFPNCHIKNRERRAAFDQPPVGETRLDPGLPGRRDAGRHQRRGMAPLRLKMCNREEEIPVDDERIAEVLRIGMLILP